jgi:hypothetical protein
MTRTCNHIGCSNEATHEIWGTADRYDYTDVCADHIDTYRIENDEVLPIGSEGVTLAGIPFDKLQILNNHAGF